MAFGEQKKKKTAFEKLTMAVVLIMVFVTVFSLVASAINTLF
ncbi:hypothetical protein ABID29_001601 [Streptococcus rupicaprae]|uniref:DUF4044 domain-containing protein n=1 Tax=Streptococcus rupicaprae TaxID=759619 RepID=A0ABV2FIU4_9STRE